MAVRSAARNLTVRRQGCGRTVGLRPMLVAELAERLGYTPDYFRRSIARLIADEAMPPPLLTTGQRRWDRGEIEAWLKGRTPPQAANDADALDDDIAGERALLAQLYGRTG